MSRGSLSPARLEAFSDGVIAVIITIMVLELKVPQQDGMAGVRVVLPTVFLYLLTFVQVGIYWLNHHYLVNEVGSVSHGILWANLAFLFCLSLFPFATDWIRAKGFVAFLYCAVCRGQHIARSGLHGAVDSGTDAKCRACTCELGQADCLRLVVFDGDSSGLLPANCFAGIDSRGQRDLVAATRY